MKNGLFRSKKEQKQRNRQNLIEVTEIMPSDEKDPKLNEVENPPLSTEITVQNVEEKTEQELPKLNLPDSVFEEDPPQFRPDITLQDTKEYIGLLLKELETVKLENAQLKIPKKEERNIWKGITVVLLLLICGAVLWYIFFESQKTEPVYENQPTATVTAVPTKGEVKPATRFIIKDLKTYVGQLSSEQTAPFTVSVVEYFGYEYLCLHHQNIRIYYRNEYQEGDEDRRRILIDNGSTLTEFDWNYDLTADISRLVPVVGAFGGDSTNQLLFIEYSEENSRFPETLHFIDTGNLFDYGIIHTASKLKGMFISDYTEQPGTSEGTETENHLVLTFQQVAYTYLISKEEYIDAVYYEEDQLIIEPMFELQFTEAGIIFTAVVSLGEKTYLGELSGTIIRNGQAFEFSNVRYGAYVEADQEDYGSDGVITPRSYPMSEYIIINGKNKERFYIEISDEIIPSTIDWKNWVEVTESNGLYEYVVDNQVTSIRGIDVSKYQGEIDWKKVKAAGVEYAIIRLGYRGMGQGTLETDPYFLKNIKGANEAGVHVGIYFFSQAVNTEEAVEEAEMILNKIKDYVVDYPIVIDTEEVTTYDARANKLTRAERTDICIAFCDCINAAGYTPMIYANTRYMIMGLELERLSKYEKWFAYYGTNYTFPYEFHMYQYSDSGIVDGIDGAVDLDVSFVDYADPARNE